MFSLAECGKIGYIKEGRLIEALYKPSQNHKIYEKEIFFLCIILATFAFAAKPIPFEYNKVRVLYIIDSFDDEKVEAVVPRSVIDSILQDVDSVYLAPFGSCECDCAGDDLYFYFSEKQKAPAKFHVNVGMPEICTGFTDNLDLVLKLKSTDKIKALADSLAKDYKPNPSKQKRVIKIAP